MAGVASELLPIVELAIAVALLLTPTAQWGAFAAVVLLLTFVGGIANALAHGWKTACHCFGIFHSEPAGPRALARNGALLAVAAIAAGFGPGPSISTWLSQRSAAELVAIGLGLVAGVLIVLLWRLNRENARLSASLAEQEAALAAIPPGLPVGAIAPAFELTDGRDGATITLESLLARGQPVLLVFIGLGCVPSADLLPDLARWQATLADRLTLAIVSHGGPSQHQFELQVLEMRDVGLSASMRRSRRTACQGPRRRCWFHRMEGSPPRWLSPDMPLKPSCGSRFATARVPRHAFSVRRLRQAPDLTRRHRERFSRGCGAAGAPLAAAYLSPPAALPPTAAPPPLAAPPVVVAGVVGVVGVVGVDVVVIPPPPAPPPPPCGDSVPLLVPDDFNVDPVVVQVVVGVQTPMQQLVGLPGLLHVPFALHLHSVPLLVVVQQPALHLSETAWQQ